MYFTLNCYRRPRALSSFHAPVCLSVSLSCRLSVRPEKRCHSNSLRISAIGLKLDVWCTVEWSKSLFETAVLGQLLRVPRYFETAYDRLVPGLRNGVAALTIWEFQLSAWNLVQWCTSLWSSLLCNMAMLGHFLRVPRKFCMIDLDQVWGKTLSL